jgi:hypothetical protein
MKILYLVLLFLAIAAPVMAETKMISLDTTPVKVTACTISSQVGELWRHGDVLGQTSFSS